MFPFFLNPLLLAVILFVVIAVWNSFRVLREYERAIIFRFGRIARAILNLGGDGNGPGLILLIPFIDKMVSVDLRIVTMDVPTQDVITKDNVPVKVNAVVYFRVLNPEDAIIKIADFYVATSQIAQTTLRSTVGQHELDDLLSNRDKINQQLQIVIDEQTDSWGIKVSAVEVKDVEIPQGMQRAMARQAEAERERRAKIIAAEGEFQASEKLTQAAKIISAHPEALQLRYLQTLLEISTEGKTTIVFPIPLDIIRGMMK
ncbi:slipin family protein [bacterium]|nr:slipin family protein [bacterium]